MAKKNVEFINSIEMVAINKLKPTEINPNFVSAELQKSLEDHIIKDGFYGAILVDKNYVIIDGFHRWLALKKLGAKQIPVTMDKRMSDQTRQIATIRFNREHGYLTPIETGSLLQMLSKQIPPDILTKLTSIPSQEMNLLMSLRYDPKHNTEQIKSQFLSWADIERYVTKIANELGNKKFSEIVAVGRGGMIPARLLADKLNIKEISMESGKTKAGCLFVDDIYDTGKTYKEIMDRQKTCLFATLLLRVGKKSPEHLIYGAVTQDDSYINFPWEKMEFKRSTKSK